MKLNIVPARTGIQWVKLGLRTFFKQPLALAGLFFMYFMAITLLGLIPFLGTAAALLLAPAATLGIMAAAREAADGRFPMPALLFTAFRAGPQRTRAMLTLGALYAAALLAVMGVAALVGGTPTAPAPAADPNALPQPELSAGLLIIVLLQLPLVVVFAHAPALVHWHGLTPTKALFFSLVAFGRNIGAYVVFGLAWAFVLVGIVMAMVLLLQLLGATMSIANLMPVALVVGAMGTCSMYFTYRDSYLTPDAGEAAPPNPAPEETP